MNIEKLRKKAGMSIEDVASKMKVSSTTIRNWERGLTSPSYGEKKLLEVVLEKRGGNYE